MKYLLLSLLACLAITDVHSRAAEPAKIELQLLKSVTVTEEQFLLGAKDGQPVTLAVESSKPASTISSSSLTTSGPIRPWP